MSGTVRFVFFDPAADVSGFAALSTAAEGGGHAFALWQAGAAKCYSRGSGPSSPLSVERADGDSWRIRFDDGDVTCGLDWRPAADAYTAAPLPSATERQQVGRVEGAATTSEGEVALAGVAERWELAGHPWADGAEQYWSLLVVQDADSCCRQTVVSIDGHDHLFGYLHRDGETRPLQWLDVAVAFAYPSGPPLRTAVTATDAGGREWTCELASRVPVSRVEASAAGRRTTHTDFPTAELGGHPAAGFVEHWYTRATLPRSRFIVRAPKGGGVS